MNKEELIKTYKILDHQKETEIRLIDPEFNETKRKPPKSIFVTNEQDFIKTCEQYEGLYNIYVGINERKKSGTNKEDVISVSTIVIDIDPIRPKGFEKQASREEELNEALKLANQIIGDCKYFTEFKTPSLAMSGNGYHLWFKIPLIRIDDENREKIELKIKHFITLFQKKYNSERIKIDQIGDLPRIIKVIGTKSIKGQDSLERPHRESFWVNYEPSVDDELKTEIMKYEPEETFVHNYVEPSRKNLSEIRKIFCNKKLQKLFEGCIEGYISRSEAEMSVVCILVKNKIPKDQIFDIMQSCRIGKWNEYGRKGYQEKTYAKALKYVTDKNGILEDTENTKILCWETAQQIMKEHNFLSYGDKERSVIYIYEDGIYVPIGKKRIHREIQRILGEKGTIRIKQEVIEHIYSSTLVDELPEAPVELVCVDNGIIDIFSKKFMPHSPDQVFFQKINAKYDPSAVCPLIEKFLNEVLRSEDVDTIKKWIGYCLLREYRFHNLLMLNGCGANGKSTFLGLMTNFLGYKNVASIPMQQLETDKFTLVLLKDKLANIFADLPSIALKSTSMLKGLTGGDHFSADQKFKEHVGFVNYAKFMYSCNELPKLPEDNNAIWRRLLLVEFPRQFSLDEQDSSLLSKLCGSGELSGLLNLALDGLKMLLLCNGFENEVNKTREVYVRKTDPIGSFVLDCVEKCSTGFITKNELYEMYAYYCEVKGYDVVVDSVFFRHFKTKIACNYSYNKVGGRQVYCVSGVKKKVFGICEQYGTTIHVLEEKNKVFFSQGGEDKNTQISHPIFINLSEGLKYSPHNNGVNIDNKKAMSLFTNEIRTLFDEKNSFSFFELQEKIKCNDELLQEILANLLSEGFIFQPRPDCFEVLK